MDIELKKAYELADAGYEVSKSIYIASKNNLLPLIFSNVNTLNQKQLAIVETFLRCQDYMGSIIEMKGYSNYQSLAAATRSMMELLFDMLMLNSDATGEMVEKRDSFFGISEFADAEDVVKFYDEHNIPHDNIYTNCKSLLEMSSVVRKQTENNSECKGNASFSKSKKNSKNHWSGMSMFERAEKLDKKNGGVKYRLMYKKFSGSLNSYVHSGYVGSVESRPIRFLPVYGFSHHLVQVVFYECSIICAECMRTRGNDSGVDNALSAIYYECKKGIQMLDDMQERLMDL